jgi:hypothetical protein
MQAAWHLIAALIFSSPAWAGELGPVAVVGMRPGYLADVKQERELRDVEMVLVPPPARSDADMMLGRPLFDAKLTKEFQNQYETRFGRTEAERNLGASNRFTFFEYPGGKMENIDAHTKRQRQFGEFMMRRLSEHHIDLYAKSNPDVRPIYELKEKIANVDVKVRKGYKVRLHYSYSGNILDAKLENPYEVESKVAFQMGNNMGPSQVERTIFSLTYPISKITSVSAFHELDWTSSTSLMGARKLTRSLSTTLTATQNGPVDRDQGRASPRQDLVLLGLSWTE